MGLSDVHELLNHESLGTVFSDKSRVQQIQATREKSC